MLNTKKVGMFIGPKANASVSKLSDHIGHAFEIASLCNFSFSNLFGFYFKLFSSTG
jgi:hypothetical protein